MTSYRDLPRYPTVSWRRGRKDSLIHYRSPSSYRFTLCGVRVPQRGVGDGDAVDLCERCIRIAQSKRGQL